MVDSIPLLGEIVCLTTALFWAISVTVFSGPIAIHGARAVNLAKCMTGALLQGLTVLALGMGGAIVATPGRDLLLLAISGLIGLVVGDTALFAAVHRIGVHRTLLLQTLSPVFAAMLAAVWIREIPTLQQVVGALIVLAGVALVVAPRRAGSGRAEVWVPAGIAAAALAAFGQGAGLVLAKQGMQELAVIPASFVRLSAAAVGLLVVAALGGGAGRLRGLARHRTTATRLLPAAFLGTYLALFLMMAGVALVPAGLAAVLLATGPVFSLLIETLVDKRPPSLRGLAGTLLAIGGVAVLSWR